MLLVVAQLGVAVAILASSGLLVLSSAGRLDLPGLAGAGAERADRPPLPSDLRGAEAAGPAAGQMVVGRLAARGEGDADAVARAAAYESALAALRDAPRLVAESLATPGAWMGRGPEAVAVNECGPCTAGGMPNPIHRTRVQMHAVMPGFFAERGMRFLAGGGFADGGANRAGRAGDGADPGQRAVVINRAYARAHFIDPVGRRLQWRDGGEEAWYDVIGVVADAPRGGLGSSGSPFAVYYSALQHPPDEVELVAAVDVPPSAGLDDSLRVVQRALDAAAEGEVVVSDLRRADDEVARLHGTAGWLGGGMRAAGVLAGLVALAGVTSTLRAHIRSRLREMGIRAALGARPRALRRMVVREALRLAVAGTALGLWAATFLVAFLSPNAVRTFSPPLFLGVAVLFIGSAVLVARPSARLAATADPRQVMDGPYQISR